MRSAIGIDLGGTSIKGGLINDKGEILKRFELSTGKGSKVVLRGIREVINELMEDGVVGIGIGSPGFIDSLEGKVLTIGGNIEGWAGTDIREELGKEFPTLPIFVENDANVAGVCEGWIGAGKGLNSFVMITLGTGLGGCIYTKKEGIWSGSKYQGAELGHAILYPNGRPCTCGQKGCSEQYISGKGLENIYKEVTGEVKKGIDIFSSKSQRDLEIVDKFIDDLSIFIVSLKNIFDPEGIVIGGGVINSKEYWWDKMVESYRKNVNDSGDLKIEPALFLNDAGIIGAGKIALDKTIGRG